MADYFYLKIRLGDAAMRAPDDIAAALERIARVVHEGGTAKDFGVVQDENGNTCGTWTVAYPEDEDG